MPLIRIGNTVIECEHGANLYEVLARKGFLDAPCGGHGLCGKCAIIVNGASKLSCEIFVTHDMTVELPQRNSNCKIISDGTIKEFVPDVHQAGELGLAFDIGTTTIVASLIDLALGVEIATSSCLNSQKACGQDVMTRIRYAHDNGLSTLRSLVIGDMNELIIDLLKTCGAERDVTAVTVAGNTTMIHILGGIDPSPLAMAPYEPAFEGALILSARSLGLSLRADCPVYCLPAVSSFVGGDITAGILACGLDEPDTNHKMGKILFIDIGTNGEIVLTDGAKIRCCSCAAGPALEGMNISCGMRAAGGAIDALNISHTRLTYSTIGGIPAVGICGSGLLSAISQMRRNNIIDRTGRFTKHPLVSEINGKPALILDKQNNIFLSQKDIRQMQLAKGAILSGTLTLMRAASIMPFELDKVIVAGQFGAHLSSDDIVCSGLLPEELRGKIDYAGNTSKSGAIICLLSSEQRKRCETLTANIEYIELSTLVGFDKTFIECLNF